METPALTDDPSLLQVSSKPIIKILLDELSTIMAAFDQVGTTSSTCCSLWVQWKNSTPLGILEAMPACNP
jgi:hypothetical protein